VELPVFVKNLKTSRKIKSEAGKTLSDNTHNKPNLHNHWKIVTIRQTLGNQLDNSLILWIAINL
jgi:hypothetical protein